MNVRPLIAWKFLFWKIQASFKTTEMVCSEKGCYGYSGSVHRCQLILSQCVCVHARVQGCMRKRSLDEVAGRVHVECAWRKGNSGKKTAFKVIMKLKLSLSTVHLCICLTFFDLVMLNQNVIVESSGGEKSLSGERVQVFSNHLVT